MVAHPIGCVLVVFDRCFLLATTLVHGVQPSPGCRLQHGHRAAAVAGVDINCSELCCHQPAQHSSFLITPVANRASLSVVSLFPSLRTLAPTALSGTPLSISRLPARPSGPSLNCPARRSWNARSLSSSPASPSRTRRLRVPMLRVLARRVRAGAILLVVAVGLAVAVVDVRAVAVAVV